MPYASRKGMKYGSKSGKKAKKKGNGITKRQATSYLANSMGMTQKAFNGHMATYKASAGTAKPIKAPPRKKGSLDRKLGGSKPPKNMGKSGRY